MFTIFGQINVTFIFPSNEVRISQIGELVISVCSEIMNIPFTQFPNTSSFTQALANQLFFVSPRTAPVQFSSRNARKSFKRYNFPSSRFKFSMLEIVKNALINIWILERDNPTRFKHISIRKWLVITQSMLPVSGRMWAFYRLSYSMWLIPELFNGYRLRVFERENEVAGAFAFARKAPPVFYCCYPVIERFGAHYKLCERFVDQNSRETNGIARWTH